MSGQNYVRDMFVCPVHDESVAYNPRPICHTTIISSPQLYVWTLKQTKGKGCECERTKKMFLHSDMLKLCLKKKRKIDEIFPDKTAFYD